MTATRIPFARDSRLPFDAESLRPDGFGGGASRGRVGMSHILCRHREFAFLVSAATVRAVVGGNDIRWNWPTESGETARAEYRGRTFPVREAPRAAAGHADEPPGVALIVESCREASVVAADRVVAVRGEDILRTWSAHDRSGGLAPEWVALHELDSDRLSDMDTVLSGGSFSRLVPELRTTVDALPLPRPAVHSTDATASSTSRRIPRSPRETHNGLLVWPSAAPEVWVGAASPFVLEVLIEPRIVPVSRIATGIAGLLPWRGGLLPVVDLNTVFAEFDEYRTRHTGSPDSPSLAAVVETELSAKWLAVSLRSAPRRMLEPVGYEPDSTRFRRSAHLLWGSFRRDREWLMLPAWERVFAKLLLDGATTGHATIRPVSSASIS